jgi:V8-like Glu-specific endopeptidase
MVYIPKTLLCALLGGQQAPRDKYSSIVSFDNQGRHHCAGVLIDQTTIITAAHCVQDDENARRWTDLTLGRHDKTGSREGVIEEGAIQLHPVSWVTNRDLS